MSTWLDLEAKFLELEAQLQGARLDYQGGAAGEYWRVAAAINRVARGRFEAVARLAGRKLLSIAGQLSSEIVSAPDDATRWYRALKLSSGHYLPGTVAYQTNDDGSYAGAIVLGRIDSPAAVSATLCLEYSTMANELPAPANPLTINVGGFNARVNLHSTDNSTNTYIASEIDVFDNLRNLLVHSVPLEQRSELLARVNEMEGSVGTPTFVTRYNAFIQAAANHMTILAPLIPSLSSLLPQ